MKVFVLYEIDFGSWQVLDIFDNIEKAQVEKASLEADPKEDWPISYSIQEWDVK